MSPASGLTSGRGSSTDFELKIEALVSKVWPSADVQVTRRAKPAQHIFEIEIAWTGQKKKHARFETYSLSLNAAADKMRLRATVSTLKLYERLLDIPIEPAHVGIHLPKLKGYAFDDNNPPGTPYTLTELREGKTLQDLFVKMGNSPKERLALALRFAKPLGQLYRKILECATNEKEAGKPITGKDPHGKDIVQIERFFPQPKKSSAITKGSQVAQLMSNNFLYLKDRYSDDSPIPELKDSYHNAVSIVQGLEKQGWLKDVTLALVDPGIGPTRFTIDNENNWTQYNPSSSAILAPAFMACRPPVWLWQPSKRFVAFGSAEWKHDGNEDWASVESEKDYAAVKQAFDEAAGELYNKYAYEKHYRFARRLGWSAVRTTVNEDVVRHAYKKESREAFANGEDFADGRELNGLFALWGNGTMKNV
ncbi:hypothetical protein GE09DRAFT_1052945 [Coniochaeta sp. 2T2.1]|nr:hypothetical protein GE09DRAFT_1052945 [Coniochaeta sp. 2T2.1]